MPWASTMSSGNEPPAARQQRAGSRKGGRCVSGSAGLAPWPKSNTKTMLDLQSLWKETSESPGQRAKQEGCNVRLLSVSLILLCSKILSGYKYKILKILQLSLQMQLLQIHKFPFFQENHKLMSLGKEKSFFSFLNLYPTEQTKPLDFPAGLGFNWITQQVLIPLFELHHP